MTEDDADTLRLAATVLTSFHKGALAEKVLAIASGIERSIPRSQRRPRFNSMGVSVLRDPDD